MASCRMVNYSYKNCTLWFEIFCSILRLKCELQSDSFYANYSLSSSQNFFRICSDTTETPISCSAKPVFYSHFISSPVFILTYLSSWYFNNSISFFYLRVLPFSYTNFFLNVSLSRMAFSNLSCIISNLLPMTSSWFERCSVSFKSPKTVPPAMAASDF